MGFSKKNLANCIVGVKYLKQKSTSVADYSHIKKQMITVKCIGALSMKLFEPPTLIISSFNKTFAIVRMVSICSLATFLSSESGIAQTE